jgi:hypothetical protein
LILKTYHKSLLLAITITAISVVISRRSNYNDFMTTNEEAQLIVSRINAALPVLVQNLNDDSRLPWIQGLTREDLTVSCVPPTFVTGNAFDVAEMVANRHEAGHHVHTDLIDTRLVVMKLVDEGDQMLAELAFNNKADKTVGLAVVKFDFNGEIRDVFQPNLYREGHRLGNRTNQYLDALITGMMLNSADDNEPASGTACDVIDGIHLYRHKALLDAASGYMDAQVQLSPRTLPRLRDDLAKEMKSYGARSLIQLKENDKAYFAQIGNALEQSNEMWWVSEDMSKLAWDVAMSGTEPEDLSENELPAPAGIIWLNGGGGPVLMNKLLPDGTFFETGTTQTELMSIDAIIWYTPTLGIPGVELGKPRFMGLTAAPGIVRDTAQWNGVLSPLDLESNEIEFHRTPTYVTYLHLKFLPRKMALVVMRLAREESVGKKTSETVGGSPNKKKNRKRRIETVTCASLRRHRYISEAEREAEARDYSHRWIVRGHMRNQPIGPRNAEGGQKYLRVWIAPYVKGPEDKPLVLKDRVQLFISSDRDTNLV